MTSCTQKFRPAGERAASLLSYRSYRLAFPLGKRGGENVKRFATLVAAAFILASGTTACAGPIEEEVQQRVEEEVQQGRTQIEEQVQEERTQIEQEAQEAQQKIEQEAKEVQQQVEEKVGGQ